MVIWTTTPWTIPANRAISYNPTIDYALYEVEALETGLDFEPWASPGDRLILAEARAADVFAAAKVAAFRRLGPIDPAKLTAKHPLAALDPGYGFDVPTLAGTHVTDDAGTGFVHTAPGHGADDYLVWLANGYKDIPETVDEDGAYFPDVPLFGGMKVMETEGKKAGKFGPANAEVTAKLIEAGNLLARGRGRAQLSALLALQGAGAVPQHAAMVHPPGCATGRPRPQRRDAARDGAESHRRHRLPSGSRPQRASGRWSRAAPTGWSAASALGVRRWRCSSTRKPATRCVDEAVQDERIVEPDRAGEGADAWFTRPAGDFLGNLDPARYEKVDDILDVWFDSGSTHAFTLEGRENTKLASRPVSRKDRTSIAAGSSPRCSRPAARAAGRRSTPS